MHGARGDRGARIRQSEPDLAADPLKIARGPEVAPVPALNSRVNKR
jgi:hypothetical protein